MPYPMSLSGVAIVEEEGLTFRVETTRHFTIKSYVYPAGTSYREHTSHRKLGALPLVHITIGRNPITGRRKVAKGVLAIGRIAFGVVPIGQLALGVLPIGQAAFGLLGTLGQAAIAPVAVGQLAVSIFLGIGQFAAGWVAVGQLGLGHWVLGQAGLGEHVYSQYAKDPLALEFFRQYIPWL